MSAVWSRALKTFEGSRVHVAFTDGRRIDGCQLMSVSVGSLWVFSNGRDIFIPAADVAEVWETCAPRPLPAGQGRWVA